MDSGLCLPRIRRDLVARQSRTSACLGHGGDVANRARPCVARTPLVADVGRSIETGCEPAPLRPFPTPLLARVFHDNAGLTPDFNISAIDKLACFFSGLFVVRTLNHFGRP